MADTKVVQPPAAHLCIMCKDSCDDDNALKCATCSSYVHAQCLVKHGRDKSVKKIQGAAPTWLHDVLQAAGIRYFCPTCLPLLTNKPTDAKQRSDLTDFANKMDAIDNKVDLLLSALVDTSQSTEASGTTVKDGAKSNKVIDRKIPSYATIAAQQSTEVKKIVLEAVNGAFKSKAQEEMKGIAVVVHGLKDNKKDLADVKDIFKSIDCDFTIARIRRLNSKPANTNKYSTRGTYVQPLLVELGSKSDQSQLLRSAKLLKDTEHSSVYIRKWLTKEEMDVDKKLREQCAKLNDSQEQTTEGKKRYVVINKDIRKRRNSGHLDSKKVDVAALLAAITNVAASQPPRPASESDSDGEFGTLEG
jgi:hypothetical protein